MICTPHQILLSGKKNSTSEARGTHVKRSAYRVVVRKSEGKRPLGSPRVDGSVILKLIPNKGMGKRRLD